MRAATATAAAALLLAALVASSHAASRVTSHLHAPLGPASLLPSSSRSSASKNTDALSGDSLPTIENAHPFHAETPTHVAHKADPTCPWTPHTYTFAVKTPNPTRRGLRTLIDDYSFPNLAIGSGNEAFVYKAEKTIQDHKQLFAFKKHRISDEGNADRSLKAVHRFYDEFQALVTLSDPKRAPADQYYVRPYDFYDGKAPGTLFELNVCSERERER